MNLAVFRTNARTSGTADTRAWVGDRHNFAFKLFIVVEADKIAIFGEALQGHHGTSAHLKAASAPDADFSRDVEKIRWTPCASIARQR